MKIESGQYYRFGTFMPFTFDYEKEYGSLADIAGEYHKYLAGDTTSAFMLWLDNWRFMYITHDCCDIHYHMSFQND